MTISQLDYAPIRKGSDPSKLMNFLYKYVNPCKRENGKILRYGRFRMAEFYARINYYDIDESISILQDKIDNAPDRLKVNIPKWKEYIQMLEDVKCTKLS